MSVTSPRKRLSDALHALDAVFAPRTEGPWTGDGCTYCYAQADLNALRGPASRVPEDLIPQVALEVPSHWGDFPALYRRMTPRIARSLAMGRLHVDPGLIASRLLEAGWRAWTPAEQEALEQVWDSWWRSVLHEPPGPGPTGSALETTGVLEVMSVSTGTLQPWLAIWAETRTETADQHLHDAVDWWLIEGGIADLHFGFYGELSATPELVQWLLATPEGRITSDQISEIKHIMRM